MVDWSNIVMLKFFYFIFFLILIIYLVIGWWYDCQGTFKAQDNPNNNYESRHKRAEVSNNNKYSKIKECRKEDT